MSTNPIRLEWTEEDEREFLREQAQLKEDEHEFLREQAQLAIDIYRHSNRDFTNLTDEFGPIYHD